MLDHRHTLLSQPVSHGVRPHEGIIDLPFFQISLSILQVHVSKDVLNYCIRGDWVGIKVVKQGVVVDLGERIAAKEREQRHGHEADDCEDD